VVGTLLRTAVRRWPPALREEQCLEWTDGGADPYSAAVSFQPGVPLVVVPLVTALARWLREEPAPQVR
jgi:hypothetical protein